MLFELLQWIDKTYHPFGFGVFSYITTRSALAAATALFISLLIGHKLIQWLEKMQLRETIRENIGLDRHLDKAHTPTMGGVILLLATLVPSLLWMPMNSVYTWMIILATLLLGVVGFVDDYIKVVKKDKTGLSGRFKLAGQILVGLMLGCTLYFWPEFQQFHTLATVPFVKNINIDYAHFSQALGWAVYIPLVIFVVTGTSNAANLTDGLDGLATGTSAIAGFILGIFAYISGRTDFSGFFNLMYLPGSGELTIFCASLVGACMGFLWYNAYPAEVFMGDTGSLALGGALGALALILHKALLLPIICGIFLVETISVIIQTTYFKYTRKRYSVGRRVFLMAPIHHHFEKKGWAEPKIVIRFWIFAVLLGIMSLLTLKLR
jgi:phospho-N-acetylmuramoyl-pentapeptide-transferase